MADKISFVNMSHDKSACTQYNKPVSEVNRSFSESDMSTIGGTEYTTPTSTRHMFVSTRLKRKREDIDLSTELSNFKEEIKNIMTTMINEHSAELNKINPTLADIKNTNHNIENAFLMAQNDEYKKKIEKLEQQSQQDRLNIATLEEKIE
ncbi:unnamed protein product [Pieris macdunnoughi]|uniref:Uncharacterized protein n=1 Tax=Pieris macdunnoughi TaxID=345717 RepID=A0A821Y0E2_9NEOP|nr:unnamed protein product [Pieris macdunnoughi]